MEKTTTSLTCTANIPMYFRLDRNCSFFNKASNEQVTKVAELCLGELSEPHLFLPLNSSNDKLFVFRSNDGSHVLIRMYDDGLVTIDLQHHGQDVSQYNTAYIRTLQQKLVDYLGHSVTEHNSLYCPVRRGQSLWPYAVSADERLLEMDYEALIFETDSAWQNIRIYRSQEYGNVLFLDGDARHDDSGHIWPFGRVDEAVFAGKPPAGNVLGEGDLIYTQTLCRIGQEDYKNKTVLILGGGDGGILHELLKEEPEFITLAEIDEEVIFTCRKYLRGACGDSLDQLSGPKHQVILDDCVKVLRDSFDAGKSYDFVINDLTEFPVDKATQGYDYDYGNALLITELSLKVLKTGGKIHARGNCLGAKAYREKFEEDLLSLGCCFNRADVYVPSFHEVYCLYEIYKDANGVGEIQVSSVVDVKVHSFKELTGASLQQTSAETTSVINGSSEITSNHTD